MQPVYLFLAMTLISMVSACGDSDSPAGTSGSPGDSGVVTNGIPAEPAGMNAWLQKKEYEAWPKESAEHESTGPHGKVLTYINPTLDASLKAGAAEHPKGSAAVKVFSSGGWAVSVKTQDASDAGKGWYWYEIFNTTPGGSGAIEGQGRPGCAGCHSGGKDFVQIPYPLK